MLLPKITEVDSYVINWAIIRRNYSASHQATTTTTTKLQLSSPASGIQNETHRSSPIWMNAWISKCKQPGWPITIFIHIYQPPLSILRQKKGSSQHRTFYCVSQELQKDTILQGSNTPCCLYTGLSEYKQVVWGHRKIEPIQPHLLSLDRYLISILQQDAIDRVWLFDLA